jgi:hypothetical protein
MKPHVQPGRWEECVTLSETQRALCESSQWDFSDLKALFLNCTLKPSPELSHTQGLIDISRAIMEKSSASVEILRPVDFQIAYGVYPDMTERGSERNRRSARRSSSGSTPALAISTSTASTPTTAAWEAA